MLLSRPRRLLSIVSKSPSDILPRYQCPLSAAAAISPTAIRRKSSKSLSSYPFETLVTGYDMGKKTKITRGGGGPKKSGHEHGSNENGSKPTHFICFPIASDETLPQISASLKHWRDITTRPFSRRANQKVGTPLRAPGSAEPGQDLSTEVIESTSTDPTTSKDEDTPNVSRPTSETFEESLKILPPAVTRAAGTWHLTLGVMKLADQARMELALDTLRGLDLQGLLRQADKGPPAGYKPARRWGDRAGESKREEDGKDNATVTFTTDNSATQQPPSSNAISQESPTLSPLSISLTGLGGFPSLRNARVLWARPREQQQREQQLRPPPTSNPEPDSKSPTLGDSTRLYNFALHIIQPFREAGLITETRSLALHATVANMRFANGKGKGKGRQTKPAWKCDRVDAREIGRVWNGYGGRVDGMEIGQDVNASDDESGKRSENEEDTETEGVEEGDPAKEFMWLSDIDLNRVAICKLGATKHEDPEWREWYPAIEGGERLIFEE